MTVRIVVSVQYFSRFFSSRFALLLFIVHVVLTCDSWKFLMFFCVDLSIAHIILSVLLNWAQCSVEMQLLGQLGIIFDYFLSRILPVKFFSEPT